MKRAVFFDIDGTLWNSNFEIPKTVYTALDKLKKEGIYSFICTGRSRSNMWDGELLSLPFDGIVAGCGTYIEMDKKVIYEKRMEQDEIMQLRNCLKELDMPVLFEGKKYMYADMEEFSGDRYVEYIKNGAGNILLPIKGNENRYDINKMSAATKKHDISPLKKRFGDIVDIISHDAPVIEILPKGFSKASGIKHVCELLDIERKNTYAFGDSANDLEMLRYVGCGIAMGNGTDEVKDVADYITDEVERDGIYNGLYKLGLIC
ncbi:MAG: Cof-type HAD-IIB family hydrolase [Lachnospiraceae bacterium]|nr:Cof-type HAD-IIB family hydrolase [Lachnospiraceae bacterium]